MNARLVKIATYAGYPLFYLLCLVVFGYYTFPYDQLKTRIIAEFDNQQHAAGSPQKLAIDSLGPYWFSGISASGVHWTLAEATSGPDGDKPATEIVLEKVHARLSLLAMLIGRTSISFGAKAFGGSIDGFTRTSGDERRTEVTLEDIDIGRVDPLAAMVGLPMSGTLKAAYELVEPEQKMSKATGSFDATITDWSLGDGKAKIQGKLALPKMNIAEFAFATDIKDGIAKLTKLGAAGPDLDLAGDGKIALRDSLGDSLADVFLRFKFSDAYKNKNDMTKSLFGTPGSSMPALFELADPRIKMSKRPDGFYGWHMSGLLKDPRFDPAPAGGGGGAGMGAGPGAAGGGALHLPGPVPAARPTGN